MANPFEKKLTTNEDAVWEIPSNTSCHFEVGSCEGFEKSPKEFKLTSGGISRRYASFEMTALVFGITNSI